MTVTATFGTLIRGDQSNGNTNTFLCTLRSPSKAVPEVRVLRLLPSKPGVKVVKGPQGVVKVPATPPPSDQPAHTGQDEVGRLEVEEHDRSAPASKPGEPGSGVQRGIETNGSVTLALKSKPSFSGGSFVWDLTVQSRVENGVEVRVLVREVGAPAFVQVASLKGAELSPPELNALTAATVKALIKPVPRLCVGLMTATPPATPEGYRGVAASGGSVAGFVAPFANVADLEAVLQQIYFLLDAPGTLDNAWDIESTTLSSDLEAQAKASKVDVEVADEVWARQITEMLLGVPYDSPNQPSNRGRGKGAQLSDLPFIGGRLGAGEKDPIVGVTFACQHLATVGIYSRGEHKPSAAFGAASTTSQTVTAMKRDDGLQAKWFVAEPSLTEITPAVAAQVGANPTLLTGSALSVDLTPFIQLPEYGPGAVHLFSNAAIVEQKIAYEQIEAALAQFPPGPDGKLPPESGLGTTLDSGSKFVPNTTVKFRGKPCRSLLKVKIDQGKVKRPAPVVCFPAGLDVEMDQQGAAHIGFTVRVRNGKAQFLDTGGLNAPNRDTPEVLSLFPKKKDGLNGGTMDDALGTQARSLASPFRGAGVFGRLQPEKANKLVNHVQTVLKRARPMGLMRLYVLQPGTVSTSNLGSFRDISASQVLYASPLKPMWDPDDPNESLDDEQKKIASVREERNYALSRYAWSLRGLNGQFQAVWVEYVPFAPVVDVMLKPGRSNPVPLFGDGIVNLTKVYRGCISLSDGTVRLLGAEPLAPLIALEGRGRSAVARVPLSKSFGLKPQNIARYFQDE